MAHVQLVIDGEQDTLHAVQKSNLAACQTAAMVWFHNIPSGFCA
jgi:hypothetical protein